MDENKGDGLSTAAAPTAEGDHPTTKPVRREQRGAEIMMGILEIPLGIALLLVGVGPLTIAGVFFILLGIGCIIEGIIGRPVK